MTTKHLLLTSAALVVGVSAGLLVVPARAQFGAPDAPPLQPNGAPAGGPIQLQNPHPFEGFGRGSSPLAPIGQPGGTQGTPPPPPPATMATDDSYLFILRDDALFQFDKKTLTLLKTVQLPRLTPPAPPDAANGVHSRTSPPLLKRSSRVEF